MVKIKFEDYLSLVETLARKRVNQYKNIASLSYDEALRELKIIGSIGLFKAIKKFSNSNNPNFKAYAITWIKGELSKEMRAETGKGMMSEWQMRDISRKPKITSLEKEKEKGERFSLDDIIEDKNGLKKVKIELRFKELELQMSKLAKLDEKFISNLADIYFLNPEFHKFNNKILTFSSSRKEEFLKKAKKLEKENRKTVGAKKLIKLVKEYKKEKKKILGGAPELIEIKNFHDLMARFIFEGKFNLRK
ncbi:sigma factor [Patescibacteria group bacterium]